MRETLHGFICPAARASPTVILSEAPRRTVPYRGLGAPTEGSSLLTANFALRPSLAVTTYYVYILASVKKTLYVGVTSDMRRRLHQHKTGAVHGFTTRYKINRLVYYEVADEALSAIAREKQLKGVASAEKDRPYRIRESGMGRSFRSHRVAADGGTCGVSWSCGKGRAVGCLGV